MHSTSRWLCLCLFLGLLLVSTFVHAGRSDRDEKEEIQQLYHLGGKALSSGNYRQAILTYREALELDVEEECDENVYLDIQFRLAYAYFQMEQHQEAEKILQEVVSKELSSHLYLRAQLLRARIYDQADHTVVAYRILKEVACRINSSEWSAEDRTFSEEVQAKLGDHFKERLLSAERLFDAALHEESIALYQEIVDAIENGDFPDAQGTDLEVKIRYRLAQAYFLNEDYKEVLQILAGQSLDAFAEDPDLWEIYKNATYLLGLSLRHLQVYGEAAKQFQRYFTFGEPEELAYYEETLWELGYCSFHLESYVAAAGYLAQIAHTDSKQRLYYLAQIYLARIAIVEGRYGDSESILGAISEQVSTTDLIHYEITYLRGLTCFQEGDMQKAIEFFELSLPNRNKEKADWYADALRNLGRSYAKLGDDPAAGCEQARQFFDKAEASLKKLQMVTGEAGVYLTLGQLYLVEGRRLGDSEALEKVETMLAVEGLFSSLDLEAEALLLRAEAADSYAAKQALYEQVTQEVYASTNTNIFGEGWFYRGVNALEMGLSQEAIASFERAADLLRPTDPALAGQAIHAQAQAFLALDTLESLRSGIALCDRLMTEESALWKAMDTPEEVLYTRGLTAYRLSDFALAEESFERAFALFPQGTKTDDSLDLLGRLLYQQERLVEAESTFVTLGTIFPASSHAGDAWFWAGQCSERLQKDPATVKQYRREVFTRYPHSKHAAEAYFNTFSYVEYLQDEEGGGDENEEPIEHLLAMRSQYPNSPFLVVAHYLIGLNAKKTAIYLQEAVDAFEAAVTTFDFCRRTQLIPEKDLSTLLEVRNRAFVEWGLTQLQIAQTSSGARQQIYREYALSTLQRLLDDFSRQEHPEQQILQECEYGLVRAHLLGGDEAAAEEILSQMFRQYADAQVTHGYILSRIWYEQAILAMKRQNHLQALTYFEQAEEAADGMLSTDEQLDLWIQRSRSEMALNKYSEATLTLSKVINIDTPSPLRIKAMVLRAELYEALDKPKLAMRQLRAAASKEGEWAQKAQEKLDSQYSYR